MSRVASAFAVACALALSACSQTFDRSLALTDQTVVPVADGDAVHVPPADMAEVMLQAGFTPNEILETGPQIGAAIATAGGAQVRKGNIVSALFAVHSGALIVTSLERGTFVRQLTPTTIGDRQTQ